MKADRVFEYAGKSQTLREWAEEYGISRGTVWNRLQAGWSFEEALTTPPRTHHRRHRTSDTKVSNWERYAQRTAHLYQNKWGY